MDRRDPKFLEIEKQNAKNISGFRVPTSAFLTFRREAALGDGAATINGKLEGKGLCLFQPAEFFNQSHAHAVL
jgi:hypothetical protein